VAEQAEDRPHLSPEVIELMRALLRAFERRGASVELILEREQSLKPAP